MTNLPTFPLFDEQVAFGLDPNSVYTQAALTAAWVSLGTRTLAANVQQGRQYELAQIQAGTGTYSFDNRDEKLNPSNTGSVYYPNVRPYALCRTVAAWTTAGGWSGNILNDTNAAWVDAPMSAEDASFEGGTTGHWVTGGSVNLPVLTNDATHVKSGTKAMKATYSGTPGANSGAYLTIAVIPNQQVTVSAWVYLTANLTGATINAGGSVGNTVSTLGSMLQTQVTLTPTTPTIVVSIRFTGTSSGSAWIDAVQPEYASTVSAFTTTGPTYYTDFQGLIESWPESWQYNGYWGDIETPVTDTFALLPRVTMQDIYTMTVEADSPDIYYPCTDPSGSLTAQVGFTTEFNPAPGPAFIHNTNNSLPTIPLDALALGDSQGVTVENLPSILFKAGTGTRGPYVQLDPLSPLINGPFTIEICFYATLATLGTFQQMTIFDQSVLIDDGTNFYTYGVQIVVASDDKSLNVFGIAGQNNWASGTILPSSGPPSFNVTDGFHHLLFTLNADQVTTRLYVDGVSVGTGTASSAVNPMPTVPSCLGPRSFSVSVSQINVGQVAIWGNRLLGATTALRHGTAAINAFAGELSGARYSRLLGFFTGTVASAVDAGMTPMAPATGLAGSDILAALNDVVTAEGGQHYVSRNGTLTFLGRARRYLSHSASWVFGEAETPYESDFATGFDLQLMWNQVTATRPGGAVQTSADTVSQGHFFLSTEDLTPKVYWDTEALDIATWTTQQYGEPRTRLQVLTFDPSTNLTAWVAALSIQQGDRVTAKRRTSAGYTMNLDFYVEQISRTRLPPMQGGAYSVSLLLSPVWTTSVWVLGDATYGVLGSTTILAR